MSQESESRPSGRQPMADADPAPAMHPPQARDDQSGRPDMPLMARIAFLLHQFNVASNRYADMFAETHNLHKTDLQALASLIEAARRGRSMNAGELSAQLHLSAPATTALLDRMSRMGHLRRRRNDFDRRIVDIHVSPEAMALGRQLFEPIARHTGRVIANFESEDQAVIERFLVQVGESVQAASEEVARASATANPGRGEDAKGTSDPGRIAGRGGHHPTPHPSRSAGGSRTRPAVAP